MFNFAFPRVKRPDWVFAIVLATVVCSEESIGLKGVVKFKDIEYIEKFLYLNARNYSIYIRQKLVKN